MKRHYLTLLSAAAITFAFALSSCVGQLERQFPWEESIEPVVPQKDTSERNFLVLDFTATWCVNCPKMATAIAELSDSCSGVIPIAVHFADEMACEASDYLVDKFSISSFPTAIINFDPELRTSVSSVDILASLAERSLSGLSEDCDITAQVSEDNGTYKIEVTVDYLSAGTYSIGAMVLEDGIKVPQIGGGSEYIHDNVLRAFLQENYSGDPLGTKRPGDKDSVEFCFTPQSQWNADALKVVVYIISDESSGDYSAWMERVICSQNNMVYEENN